MRIVGKRKAAANGLRDQARLARMMAFVRGTTRIARRGVYRFSSFEAAEAWLIEEMIETRVIRSRE